MTPIEREIDRLQDAGHHIYIDGWSDDGRYCVIVGPEAVTVASYATANGIGRWEGSREWYAGNQSYMRQRFPRPTRAEEVAR